MNYEALFGSEVLVNRKPERANAQNIDHTRNRGVASSQRSNDVTIVREAARKGCEVLSVDAVLLLLPKTGSYLRLEP